MQFDPTEIVHFRNEKVDPQEILDRAVNDAIERFDIASLNQAADSVMRVFKNHGFIPIDGDFEGYRNRNVTPAILRGMVARMYPDEVSVRSFLGGYYRAFSHDGQDLPIASGLDQDAWEAGCAANPQYRTHLDAKARADQVFLAKFGVAIPTTDKGHLAWMKAYRAAFDALSK